MTRPYSMDLRLRVVSAVQSGETCRSVAARFSVAVSSVVKWHQRYRSTGSVAPGQMGGHRRRVLDPHRDFIIGRIGETPHLTVRCLRDILERVMFKLKRSSISVAHGSGPMVRAGAGAPAGRRAALRPGAIPYETDTL
jgi:transposase